MVCTSSASVKISEQSVRFSDVKEKAYGRYCKIASISFFTAECRGLGFRYFSVYKARLLGLAGWVKNLDDGSVEMEVQGKEAEIDTADPIFGRAPLDSH